MFGEGFVMNLPRFFTIFGFNIYYYGLFITAGYALAGVYLIKRRQLFRLTTDNLLDLVIIAVVCGLVGARLYYMIFNFDNFFAPGKWGNIFRLREGGLAVYGGIIASGLGFLAYSRIKKIPFGSTLDAAGFGLFIGQAVGRWGNFINREAYGVETDLPWRMGLTTGGSTIFVHPAFLYESLWNLVGLLIMHVFSKKSKTKYPGQYFLFYVAWYGLGRFMIEGLRTDSLLIPGTDNRVSQWLGALSCLAALIILFVNFLKGKEVELPELVEGNDSESDEDYDNLDDLDGEDDLDDEDEDDGESADELAELDGASEDEVRDESDDELENKDSPKDEKKTEDGDKDDDGDKTEDKDDNKDEDTKEEK